MAKTTINDVSDTALWVAVYRAQESERPDALFHDPLAGRLAGERGRTIAATMSGSRYTSWSVIIRTHIIDNYIQELLAQGVDTVVNLGCGLDTRPYRMNLPPTLRWIEVDYPHMIELKEQHLAGEKPKCKLERIGLDLANQEARKKFFTTVGSSATKALILTEGVVPYLTSEQVASLAEDLRQQKNFRFWIVDYFSPKVMGYIRTRRRRREMQNAPFQFCPADWFGFFAQYGWKARETRYLAEESEKLGRDIPMPFWAKILRRFIRAKSREAFRKFSAYVLLEPHH